MATVPSDQWSAPQISQPHPTPRRQLRPWLVLTIAAVTLCGLAAVLILTLTGGTPSPYGKDPVAAARQLKLCPSPVRSKTVAVCHTPDGDVSIATTRDATEQDFLVASIQDAGSPVCNVVLKGVVIGAADAPILTSVVGDVAAFAKDHGGYALCPV